MRRPIYLDPRLTADQRVEYLENYDRADQWTLALARLLYEAAFPTQPLGEHADVPPLYLRQAVNIRSSGKLAASIYLNLKLGSTP